MSDAKAVATQIGFLPYLESKLDLTLLESLAVMVVTSIEASLAGKTDDEKKATAVKQCLTVLEAFDNKLPVIGQWMDFPVVDYVEAWAVGVLIDWAWLKVFGVRAAATAAAAPERDSA